MESPTAATYPSAGGRARLKGASSKKGKHAGVTTNVYSRKCQKNQKGSANLKNKGSGVVYVWRRYQHPTYLSQGTTTFNQVCKIMSSIFILFSLFYVFFLLFFLFYVFYFFSFLCFLLFGVDKGAALAPTYHQVLRELDR